MERRLLLSAMFMAAFGLTAGAQTWYKTPQKQQHLKQVEKTLQSRNSEVAGQMFAPQAEGGLWYSYCGSNVTGVSCVGPAGDVNVGHFEAAIYFPESMMSGLAGNKLTKVRIVLGADSESNFTFWVREELDGENLASLDITEDMESIKWLEYEFENPYEVTGKGFYLGYSFDLDELNTENDEYPIACGGNNNDNGLYVKFPEGEWNSLAGEGMGSLVLMGFIEGNIPDIDASIDIATYNRAMTGGECEIQAMVSNNGAETINSIDIAYEIDGKKEVQSATMLTGPIATMEQGVISLMVDVPAESGQYIFDLTVDKVNGKTDENDMNDKGQAGILGITKSSPRKTVIEEGTGTWCGWCPRGIAGMEKMAELYPDNFVGIAIHVDDILEIEDYAPLIGSFTGFPSALIDRLGITDPYLGDNATSLDFGLGDVFEGYNARLCEASLEMSAEWADDSQTAIDVTSVARFNFNNAESVPYKMTYVIVEDGITAESIGEAQANYYNEFFYSFLMGGDPDALPEDLQRFRNAEASITDITFNDVAVAVYDCMGIEGSFEGVIEEGAEKTHTYTLNLPETVRDKNNITVIGMLLDDATGEVVNAEEIKLGESTIGIEETASGTFKADASAANGMLVVTSNAAGTTMAQVYTMDGVLAGSFEFAGQAVLNVGRGAYIVRLTDGSNVIVKKVLL